MVEEGPELLLKLAIDVLVIVKVTQSWNEPLKIETVLIISIYTFNLLNSIKESTIDDWEADVATKYKNGTCKFFISCSWIEVTKSDGG